MESKDTVEVDDTVVIWGAWRAATYLSQNASAVHSDVARRQSYARGVTLRFVERANYLSPKMNNPASGRGFRFREL